MSTEVLLKNEEKEENKPISDNAVEKQAEVVSEPKVATNSTNLTAEFNKIDREFESQYPVFDENKVFGERLEYKQVSTPTETELNKMANESLEEYKNSSIQKIENDLNNDMSKLNLQEEQTKSEFESTANDLQNELAVGLEKQKAENISQGIERSSIAVNRANAFKAEIDHELEVALNKANMEIAEITLKKGIAESEFQSALESFDIAYASKLEKKISDLSKEYAKKQAEALDYNEKITQQREIAYNNWKEWADNYTLELNEKKAQKKAYYIIEQIKGMSKREATAFINDPEIVTALGGWYNAVVDYIQRILK